MSAAPNHKFLKNKSVSIIGVPFNGGQPRTGVEDGPIRLVEFGLLNQVQEMGWSVDYESNESIHSLRPTEDPDVLNLKQPKYVSAVTEHVSKQIYQSAKDGKFVLTLGGDHSIALATVSGVFSAYPDACLIWVDAHAVSCNVYEKK
jgi:arginase